MQSIQLLRECADALDALPVGLRWASIMGAVNSAQKMRNEADHIEQIVTALQPRAAPTQRLEDYVETGR